MDTPPVADVCLLTDDAEAARRWVSMLAAPECRIRWSTGDDITGAAPELILTDWPPDDPRLVTVLGAIGQERLGLIRLGPIGPCDVWLSDDPPQRQLRLACRLLAEVVRLRRRQFDANETHRRLAEHARTDALTGLPNRRDWDETLAASLAKADAPRCVAICDLDHFKRVNDIQGHVVGDAVLRSTAAALRDGLRRSDLVARLGGDEFGLLLDIAQPSTAAMVLDRIRASLPGRLAHDGFTRVTVSIGFHCTVDTTVDQAMEIADAALRQAKCAGRDRVVAG